VAKAAACAAGAKAVGSRTDANALARLAKERRGHRLSRIPQIVERHTPWDAHLVRRWHGADGWTVRAACRAVPRANGRRGQAGAGWRGTASAPYAPASVAELWQKRPRSERHGHACPPGSVHQLETSPLGQLMRWSRFCPHTHTRASVARAGVDCASHALELAGPPTGAPLGVRRSCAAAGVGAVACVHIPRRWRSAARSRAAWWSPEGCTAAAVRRGLRGSAQRAATGPD
jgi:hypothetical protein